MKGRALITLFAIALVLLVIRLRSGLSAREEPTRVEAFVARTMRHFAVPSNLRDAKNPVPLTGALLTESRAHFADHCAVCHGNDGKGGAMGKQMYPQTPDLTLAATQSLSDGELFATIENGVRLTGMPGFGNDTPESRRESWALVHFIRHLPKLTLEEIAEIESLTPRSPAEWKELEAEKAFLAGETH